MIISGLMDGEQSIDLSELEYPESEFLFEIDPFDDIIRWRFYTTDASIDQTSEIYIERLPDFSVTQDEMMNGYRHFVLSSGHPGDFQCARKKDSRTVSSGDHPKVCSFCTTLVCLDGE